MWFNPTHTGNEELKFQIRKNLKNQELEKFEQC
jgi:hypothetical protein